MARLSWHIVAAALLLGLVSACGSSDAHPAASSSVAPPIASSLATLSPVASAPTTSSASGAPSPTGTSAGSSDTGMPSQSPIGPTPSPSISIPPNLCAATDQPQNTADAYMGALSAGEEKQATDCVFPNTVPAATTHGLLATAKGTAVYLPQPSVDGPTVFGYTGNGKIVRVTVTREADGKTWVTAVTVAVG